jgi:hypothetical protein
MDEWMDGSMDGWLLLNVEFALPPWVALLLWVAGRCRPSRCRRLDLAAAAAAAAA